MANTRRGKDLTTSKLLTLIRSATTFSEAIAAHDATEEPNFSAYLYELMTARSLTPKDIVALSGIERSYFYHILSGEKRPGRNMVLRMAFSMGATLNETNHLLKLAGLSDLYPRIRRDAALIFCLQRKYTLSATNDFLLNEGEEPLYREDNNA